MAALLTLRVSERLADKAHERDDEMSNHILGRRIKCGIASIAAFMCIGVAVAAAVVTSGASAAVTSVASGNPWG